MFESSKLFLFMFGVAMISGAGMFMDLRPAQAQEKANQEVEPQANAANQEAPPPVGANAANAVSAVSADNSAALPDEGVKNPFVSYLPVKEEEAKQSVAIQSTGEGTTPEEQFDYSGLHVTGIVWGNDKPKAIIDEKVVGIGDIVNNATIENITKEGILFKFKDKEYLMKRAGSVEEKKIEQVNKGG